MLTYYAIANASALTLEQRERRQPMFVAVVGLTGCVALAGTLPWQSAVAAAAVVAAGSVRYLRPGR